MHGREHLRRGSGEPFVATHPAFENRAPAPEQEHGAAGARDRSAHGQAGPQQHRRNAASGREQDRGDDHAHAIERDETGQPLGDDHPVRGREGVLPVR